MKRYLIFLVFLVLPLCATKGIELSNSPESLRESKTRLLFLSETLEAEMNRLEKNLEKLSKENERQRSLLEERRKSINRWLDLLRQQKEQLQLLEQKLFESEKLQTQLSQKFDEYKHQAESLVRVWKIIAIGEAIIIIGCAAGITIYLIAR